MFHKSWKYILAKNTSTTIIHCVHWNWFCVFYFSCFFCEAKQYDKHVYVYKQSIVKIILFNKLYYGKIFTKIFAKCVLHKSQHTMKTTNNENSNDKNMRLNWYACWLISLSKVKVKYESKQNKKPQNRRWKN